MRGRISFLATSRVFLAEADLNWRLSDLRLSVLAKMAHNSSLPTQELLDMLSGFHSHSCHDASLSLLCLIHCSVSFLLPVYTTSHFADTDSFPPEHLPSPTGQCRAAYLAISTTKQLSQL